MTSESKRKAYPAEDLPAGGNGCALPWILLDQIGDYLPLGGGSGGIGLPIALNPRSVGAFGLLGGCIFLHLVKGRVQSLNSEKEAHILKGLEEF